MRHLNKPTDDPKTVFLNCIAEIADPDLKGRLGNCADIIKNEAIIYEKKAPVNELHTLTKSKSTKANKNKHVLAEQVTITEMKDVYTKYLVPHDSPGRGLYDRLLAIPQNSKCPYCFHRQVSTIDHYLPKAYYPLLSVVPINLVPSCKDCNLGLLGIHASQASEEILHPYYDNVEDQLWLKAEVRPTSPASLNFFVDCPSNWDEILKKRVMHHFDTLKLNLLYGAEAANELSNIKFQLQDQFRIGGEEGVRKHLTQAAASRQKNYTNSWQTAMYSALSTDNWFCNRGYEF